MGEYDYVPRVLGQAGVTVAFHKVAIKPGKPTLYGYAENTEVIGLPGNPVSVFILFEVLVRPLLLRRMGIPYEPSVVRATTADEIRRRNDERLEFRPVALWDGRVHTIAFHGSSHVQALANANGLIQIEIGCRVIPAGTEVDVRQI
jgi:molybdopterin molybdotransferase